MLSLIIISLRFIIPGWGINTPVYVSILAVLFTILSIALLRDLLLNFFTDIVIAIVLIMVVAATNFLCLSTYEPDLFHPLLFFCYLLILWSTMKWSETFHWRYALLLGMAAAVTIALRRSEVSCLLIPFFWAAYNKKTIRERGLSLKRNYGQLVVMTVIILVIVMGQILRPHFLGGIPGMSNLRHNRFIFIAPYLPDVLLSFRKGWLIYTPVMIFAIAGFYFLAAKNPFIFYATFLFFIVELYIVASRPIWWEGESFGQRSMISSYTVLALPLGYFTDWLLHRKAYLKIPLFLIFCFFLVLNIFQTWQYTRGILDSSRMTREYYGAIFGAIQPVKGAEKYLLEEYPSAFREEIPNEHLFNKRVIAWYDFEKQNPSYNSALEKGLSRSGEYSLRLDKSDQFSPGINKKFSDLTHKEDTWIRLSAYVFFVSGKAIRDAFLVVTANHNGNAYKYKALPLDKEDLIPGQWNKVSMDWQTPYLMDKDNDLLQSYIWYPGKRSIFVDDIQIDLFEPRE